MSLTGKFYRVGVDRDRGQVLVGDVVGIAEMDESPRVEEKAVERLGIVRVVGDEDAGDVRLVVHAPLVEVVVVVEDLIWVVGGDGRREGDSQSSPRLSVFVPWLDLVGLHAGVGEHKGCGEVVPGRSAREVGDLDRVPWRVVLVGREGRAGIVTSFDELSGSGPDL